jgi:hypothetical protein
VGQGDGQKTQNAERRDQLIKNNLESFQAVPSRNQSMNRVTPIGHEQVMGPLLGIPVRPRRDCGSALDTRQLVTKGTPPRCYSLSEAATRGAVSSAE